MEKCLFKLIYGQVHSTHCITANAAENWQVWSNQTKATTASTVYVYGKNENSLTEIPRNFYDGTPFLQCTFASVKLY